MTEAESNAAPMRLRTEPPRVTRLSRKMLASVAAVALVGIGGALIYALQTRGPGNGASSHCAMSSARRSSTPAGRCWWWPAPGRARPGC